MLRTVTREELDAELKRISREGVERLVSVTTADDGGFVIKTEARDEPKLETRGHAPGESVDDYLRRTRTGPAPAAEL